jgi:hypothetical protein
MLTVYKTVKVGTVIVVAPFEWSISAGTELPDAGNRYYNRSGF